MYTACLLLLVIVVCVPICLQAVRSSVHPSALAPRSSSVHTLQRGSCGWVGSMAKAGDVHMNRGASTWGPVTPVLGEPEAWVGTTEGMQGEWQGIRFLQGI